MRIGSIWLGCKMILTLVIVGSFIAQMALSQQPITVSGSNFQLSVPYIVTKIEVSHSNSGQSGTVWLIDQSGNNYGPWVAEVRPNMWVVHLNEYLSPGSYRLIDSDPGTYQGQARIYGSPQQPPHQPPTPPSSPDPSDPQDPSNPPFMISRL
jgi:hypothetical protein